MFNLSEVLSPLTDKSQVNVRTRIRGAPFRAEGWMRCSLKPCCFFGEPRLLHGEAKEVLFTLLNLANLTRLSLTKLQWRINAKATRSLTPKKKNKF